jgi:predicted dienelactone hydrolase
VGNDDEAWSERGPHPVGVTTIDVLVPAREASIPAEIWYPADEAHRGADIDVGDEYDLIPGVASDVQAAVREATPAQGALRAGVVFSHGMAGHRRQSTFLCTHLASHGFVVASPDHLGNTLPEMLPLFMPLDAEAIEAAMVQSALLRPGDLVATIDALGVQPGLAVDTDRVGAVGHSFGGWSVLAVVASEPRVAAVVGLAPGGGRIGDDTRAGDLLDLAWDRAVATLLIAADGDTVIPIESVRDLATRVPGAVLVVLEGADHYHFCDDARSQHELVRSMGMPGESPMRPFDELCPEDESERFVRSEVARHLAPHLLAAK